MNKTVELVKLWGEFEEKNPGAGIEDFFRYQLTRSRGHLMSMPEFPGISITPDSRLMMLIGRIAKMHLVYAGIALEGTGLDQMEEFGMLITIMTHAGDPRKTDAILTNMQELSSGTNMLERLKKKGLIEEYDDETDRRSKRLKLTAEGRKIVPVCRGRVAKLAAMMMHELDDEDKLLIIQLLQGTEAKFMARLARQKGKSFDEIYKENINGE
jgi:DNA-binding MarR family transcriptional regulator